MPADLPACIHDTNGRPWFENWQDVASADLWLEETSLYERQAAA